MSGVVRGGGGPSAPRCAKACGGIVGIPIKLRLCGAGKRQHKNRYGGSENFHKQTALIQRQIAGTESLQTARRARPNRGRKELHDLGQMIC